MAEGDAKTSSTSEGYEMNDHRARDALLIQIGALRLTASGRFAIMVIAIPAAGVLALVAGHYCGFW